MELKNTLKLASLTGLILLFTSLFLDWYNFQVFSINGTLLVNWTYNIFSEWSTNGTMYNEQLKPGNLFVPIMINIIVIVVILICIFGMVFKGIESEGELNNLYPFIMIIKSAIFILFCFITQTIHDIVERLP